MIFKRSDQVTGTWDDLDLQVIVGRDALGRVALRPILRAGTEVRALDLCLADLATPAARTGFEQVVRAALDAALGVHCCEAVAGEAVVEP